MDHERKPDHRTPEDVVLKVLGMLRTSEFSKVAFRTDMEQDVVPIKPADRDGKVSLAITTKIGNRRTERWPIDKVADFMRSGFWFAELGGVVHDGGFAQVRQARRDEDAREMGDFLEGISLKKMFVAALGAAGLDKEARSLDAGSLNEFDLQGAKAFLAGALRAAGPDVLDRLKMAKKVASADEDAGFRP